MLEFLRVYIFRFSINLRILLLGDTTEASKTGFWKWADSEVNNSLHGAQGAPPG